MSATGRSDELRALGLRTRVFEAGTQRSNEAVVFIHGGPGSADDWDDLLPRIGAFARAIAIDLPGFGHADKPGDWWGYTAHGWACFLACAFDQLEVRRAHLVVHDLGGEAALVWAAAHPDAFASAILINGGNLIGYRWHAIARLHRAPLAGRLAARAGGLGFRAALRLYEPQLPQAVLERWKREYDWGTRRALLRFYRAAPAVSPGRLGPELRRLDKPALVIWGEGNRFIPVEQAQRQRESFPSADVVVLPRSRHYSHLDSPDRVAELAVPFLREQLGVAATSRA